MFTTVESFINEYQIESATTQQLLDTLTDDSLKQTQAEGYRTAWLYRLASRARGTWHAATERA